MPPTDREPPGDISLISTLKTDVNDAVSAALSSPNPAAAMGQATPRILRRASEFFKVELPVTYAAILDENAQHGEARGPVGKPEPPTPGKSRVDQAYALQLSDIETIINKRLQAQV